MTTKLMIVVIWTSLLLSPSDGALDENGWGTFYDHYGDNLEGIDPMRGDVMQKDNGPLLLIFDRRNYFQMHSLEIAEGERQVQSHFYDYPKPEASYHRKLLKVRSASYPSVTRLLAGILAEKYLPYHPVHCNREHWMNYILYGTTVHSRDFPECPLRTPFSAATEQQIRRGEFRLLDASGVEHDLKDYCFPRDYVRPGTSRQAERSASTKRLKRARSVEKDGNSSFKRIVTRPFNWAQWRSGSV